MDVLINKKRREKKGMHQYVPPVLGKEKRTGPAVIVWKSNDELSYRSAGRRSKTPSAAAAPGGSDARRRRKTMKWRLPGAWAFVAENKLYLLHPSPCRPVPKCPLAHRRGTPALRLAATPALTHRRRRPPSARRRHGRAPHGHRGRAELRHRRWPRARGGISERACKD
jgi:hypothetical protein